MKFTLLLLTIFISSLCFSQTLVDVSKIYFRKDITLSDGLIYKYDVVPNNDTARYFIPGNDEYQATIVFVKKGGVTNPVLKETLNDNSARVVYTGTWVKWANQTWTTSFLNNDVSVTSVVNSAATVTFTGKKVSVIAEFRENHGVAKIEVKQGATVIDSKIVDMYSATAINAPAAIYTSAILPQGTYTVTVSLNSITTGKDSLVLDSFLVFE